MKKQEYKRTEKYDGFFLITVIYFLTLLIASFVPFVLRTILSFLIRTPGLVETNGDASKLFNIVYPVVGIILLGGFLFAGWLSGFIVGKKIAYETSAFPNVFWTKIHFTIAGSLIFIVNMYFGFMSLFSGTLGIQFWYLSATISSLFGVFDEKNLLIVLNERSIFLNNFVLEDLTFFIIPAILIIAIISSVFFTVFAFKGLYKGSAQGKADREEFVRKLREEN